MSCLFAQVPSSILWLVYEAKGTDSTYRECLQQGICSFNSHSSWLLQVSLGNSIVCQYGDYLLKLAHSKKRWVARELANEAGQLRALAAPLQGVVLPRVIGSGSFKFGQV